MVFHTGLSPSDAILLSALGIGLTIAGSAIGIAYYLGSLGDKLDKLDEVSTLTTQIDTLTNTFDVRAAGNATSNIETIREDVENIEGAITAVDLPGIQDAIREIYTSFFDEDSLPIGNSVHYTLDDSGVEIAISLAGVGEGVSKVHVRFDREVQTASVSELLTEDEYLSEFETKHFGSEVKINTPSPRQLNITIQSSDVDEISEWVPEFINKLDECLLRSTATEEMFDQRVEEALKNDV